MNGESVIQSEMWQEPIEVDVQKFLKRGENVLEAKLYSEGSVAAFALKLKWVDAQGTAHYVVTDDSWKILPASRGVGVAKPVTVTDDGPWADAFSSDRGTGAGRSSFFGVARLSGRALVFGAGEGTRFVGLHDDRRSGPHHHQRSIQEGILPSHSVADRQP